ncbi:hypothetical protein GCK32_005335 [Trichostrongylus colubriformis]|uniref:Uncharacterized protein n=1 Tax=Trichostrongylus colubriformis TaxID=6319 RepID=A0AAN8INK4_TRICO
MLGYSPMELHQFKPDLYDRDLNGYIKVFWDTMDLLKSFALKLDEAPKEVLNAFIKSGTHGLSVEPEVKTRLADIFDGLTPQKQNL